MTDKQSEIMTVNGARLTKDTGNSIKNPKRNGPISILNIYRNGKQNARNTENFTGRNTMMSIEMR